MEREARLGEGRGSLTLGGRAEGRARDDGREQAD